MVGFVILAVLVNWLDRAAPSWIMPVRNLLDQNLFREVSRTNDFLSMLTTGLITMTSITFSMLLLSLQQSATIVGAQVVYSFLLRRRNQVLLGSFLGVTLFVLFVHAGAHQDFNPVIGATMSLLFTAAALYALALLLFTAVNQMRPQTILGELRTQTLEARRRQRELLLASYRAPRYTAGTQVSVTTERRGYLRDIDLKSLREALRSQRGKVEIEFRVEIGDYVAYGQELAQVRAELPQEAERLAPVTKQAMKLDYQRAVQQDPSFGINQILMIGWSSGSTAQQNPGVTAESIHNLRDIIARWVANYDEVEDSDGTLPLVYPDGLVEDALIALESLAMVATESLQAPTFGEVMDAYHYLFPRLPHHLQERAATSLCRLVTGLGDLVMTPTLEKSLRSVVETLRKAEYGETADAVETAKRQMASAAGELAARSTRVQAAKPNGSG